MIYAPTKAAVTTRTPIIIRLVLSYPSIDPLLINLTVAYAYSCRTNLMTWKFKKKDKKLPDRAAFMEKLT